MATAEEIIAAPGDVTTSLADRLERARKRKDDRAKLEADERATAEVERSELAERFEKELNGREGRDFAIVDFSEYGEGCVVVKLGPMALFKSYMASEKTEMHTDAFITPCVVYPSVDRVRAMVAKRMWLGTRITNALAILNGIEDASQKGK